MPPEVVNAITTALMGAQRKPDLGQGRLHPPRQDGYRVIFRAREKRRSTTHPAARGGRSTYGQDR
jgi:hypothetical protein